MKKLIFWSILSIAVGFAVWYFFFREKTDADQAGKKTGTTNQTSTATTGKWPIQLGSYGPEVQNVQKFLNMYVATVNLKPLIVTGSFNPETMSALKRMYNITEVSQDFYNNTILKRLAQ